MAHGEDPSARYQPAWQRLWADFGVPHADNDLLPALVARYSETHRRYHTLQHLDACFKHLATARQYAAHAHEVELALWFHDAIYDIGSSTDNELRSADWARSALLSSGVDERVAQRVHALVMVTCHKALPATADEAILIDVDLAILGAPPAVFDAYEAQITAEYASVPEQQRRRGRVKILQEFLDRERIYHTPRFYELRETQARANLQRSIAQLAD